MTTRKMIGYALAAGSRGTLRPHLPSAAQIRRGADPRAVALYSTQTTARIRAVILLGLLCGLAATSLAGFHSGAHAPAGQAAALAPR